LTLRILATVIAAGLVGIGCLAVARGSIVVGGLLMLAGVIVLFAAFAGDRIDAIFNLVVNWLSHL
jgi:hypothetical protein